MIEKNLGDEMKISLYDVLVEDERRPRAKTCEATIKEYAEFVQNGGEFPPIVVFYDGESYLLADGEHRLEAYKLEGRDMVTAIVYEGGRKDALIYALGSNAEHGLRRTNTDKRRVVIIALTDLDVKGLSDNQVSKMCKVSQPFVSKVKKELIAEGYEFDATRLCADGRTINTSDIGRNKQTEPVISNEVDADNDPPSEEIIEENENLSPESEDQKDQDLNEDTSEDDPEIDDAESEKRDSAEFDLENDNSLEKEIESEIEGDDSNAPDKDCVEEDPYQTDDTETDNAIQEEDVTVEAEDDGKDSDEASESDSDAAANNGETVSNDSANSDLGAIDDVNTLKDLIVQLRTCNKEQEDQIAGLEVQVAALQEQVTSLETNNEYLTEKLERQDFETMA